MARTSLTLSRSALIVLAAFVGALTMPWHPASAFTEKQVEEVFAKLDTNKTGRVDKAEYDENKVAAMFWTPKTGSAELGALSYEQTEFNRAFFDAADTDHKGKLDGVDMIYALEFEKIDLDHKGYITIDDLRRFMQTAGRPASFSVPAAASRHRVRHRRPEHPHAAHSSHRPEGYDRRTGEPL